MTKIKYTQGDIVSHHGVSAVIKNEKEEILMQEHAKYGFWTIPIGKVEVDQDIEEGLKQEILEECNLTIEDFKELTNRNYSYKRNGKKVNVITHLFEVTSYKGDIKNNEPKKHKQQIFISLNKIKKLPYLSDSTLLYLETLGFKRDAKI